MRFVIKAGPARRQDETWEPEEPKPPREVPEEVWELEDDELEPEDRDQVLPVRLPELVPPVHRGQKERR